MQVRRVAVTNFRGIRSGHVVLDGHSLLVGGNSVGKSSLCEALDLVLGPERMFRRPVVDEYDFHEARYLDADGVGAELEIEVVLMDLSPRAQRRFGGHLKKWDPESDDFAEVEPGDAARFDALPWCLPVLFHGRFNTQEDDFEGGTFFSSPEPASDDLTPSDERLGGGRRAFTREDKRHCGFLYLRPHRTGARALSLQRGSLLDTIVRLEAGNNSGVWEHIRTRLANVSLAENGTELASILDGVTQRIGQFINLGSADDAVQVHASELTRENIREALRVFVASKPGTFPVPFSRLSTGSLHLLVFSLLTYIAELHQDTSVIFAIEEPEMALPPHSQRRLVDFALTKMGQAIVTSHSPYIIERFEPQNIIVLHRSDEGVLSGGPVKLPSGFKPRRYRENRRQFAEAVLARAVFVVEGATEASIVPVVADILDRDDSTPYTHIDLAGVSVFDAGNDVSVPLYAPLFKSLGKPVFGMTDTPTNDFSKELLEKAADFTAFTVIPFAGIEDLLISELPAQVKRRFLRRASTFEDYPNFGAVSSATPDSEVDRILRKTLRARKGANAPYAAELVAEATNVSELPRTIVEALRSIDQHLTASADEPTFPATVELDLAKQSDDEVQPEPSEINLRPGHSR